MVLPMMDKLKNHFSASPDDSPFAQTGHPIPQRHGTETMSNHWQNKSMIHFEKRPHRLSETDSAKELKRALKMLPDKIPSIINDIKNTGEVHIDSLKGPTLKALHSTSDAGEHSTGEHGTSDAGERKDSASSQKVFPIFTLGMQNNSVTEPHVVLLHSLEGNLSIPVAVDYLAKKGKTGAVMQQMFANRVQTVRISCRNRPGTDEPLMPLERMPFGLVQYQIDFFTCTNVQQVKVPDVSNDYRRWQNMMELEFGERFNKLFRGLSWSGCSQEDIKNPMKESGLNELKQTNPKGRFSIKIDGTDIKPALQQSTAFFEELTLTWMTTFMTTPALVKFACWEV
uniref:Uncharacterized protein n=1 Tax=Branchiostoma floridae TaxID=7739 RepID=C3XT15_BRAFL|eukprot:XP_002612739.1 hypothetical protein BRAFLDRAFT_97281 [Branchiostoma floridae]